MKIKLFISYSDYNRNIIEIIKTELEDNENFEPVIVASKRQPQKLLSEKVIDGIEESMVVIPILTKESIPTQWINQEIGYSIAKKKILRPIVEIKIIDKLKGFIHKQTDLSHWFSSEISVDSIEDHSFISCFRLLISDLQREFVKPNAAEKNVLDEAVEKVNVHQEYKRFQRERSRYFELPESFESVLAEINNLFSKVDSLAQVANQRGLMLKMELQHGLLIQISGYGLGYRLAWKQKYSNTLVDSVLLEDWIHVEDGQIKPGERKKYSFDIDRNFEPYWRDEKDSKLHKSENIAQEGFNRFLEQVSEKLSSS